MTIKQKVFAAYSVLTAADMNAFAANQVVQVDSNSELTGVASTTKVAWIGGALKVKGTDGVWRAAGSPITVTTPFTDKPGSYGVTGTMLTSYRLNDPGYPFKLAIAAYSENGSTQAGTRWDTALSFLPDNGPEVVLGIDLGIDGQIQWRKVSTDGPSVETFTGGGYLYYRATQAYGGALGSITGLNRQFRFQVYAA